MAKHLVPGEQVVVRTRAYGGALIAPAVWTVLLAGLAGVWHGYLSTPALPLFFQRFHYQATWVGIGVIILLAIPTVVRPLAAWFSNAFELTTHRVAQRVGIFSVRRRWLAVANIAQVRLRQSRRQRFNGVGDVQLLTHQGQSWVLRNVPEVVEFLRLLDNQRYASTATGGYADFRPGVAPVNYQPGHAAPAGPTGHPHNPRTPQAPRMEWR